MKSLAIVILFTVGVALGLFLARDERLAPVLAELGEVPLLGWLAAPGDDEAGADGDAADDDEDNDDDDEGRDRALLVDGVRVIGLTDAERALLGVETETVARDTVVPEELAFARVLDEVTLLTRLEKLRYLGREITVQRQTEAELAERVGRLGASVGSASERLRLNTELRQVRRDRIRLEADRSAAQLDLRAEFGTLVDLLADDPALVKALEAREESLLRLSLPVGMALPEGLRTVFVSESGRRVDARKAYVLTRAPAVGQMTLSPQYFLRTARGRFTAGLLLDAHIPQPEAAVVGIVVPASAEVWHEGLRWVFTDIGDNRFQRHRVDASARLGERLVVATDLPAGAKIVTRGGQALLAEEFRGAIPVEDDD